MSARRAPRPRPVPDGAGQAGHVSAASCARASARRRRRSRSIAQPLQPELWPNWQQPVNRERIYDFYAKEAEYFRKQPPVPPLLPPFPGLDGGKHGHWGNQNEETWADGRWNQTDARHRSSAASFEARA